DLLPDFIRRYLSKLSELRNSVVHNVNQVGFKLPDYVRGLNKEQFEAFMKSVESIDYDEVDFGKNNERRVEWVAKWARELIYRYALYTMALIYMDKELADVQRTLSTKAIEHVTTIASAIRKARVPASDDAT
ncbi:MAG: hypothetical protein ACREA9_09770, partial [Pyrinomonadaceae bacterium]